MEKENKENKEKSKEQWLIRGYEMGAGWVLLVLIGLSGSEFGSEGEGGYILSVAAGICGVLVMAKTYDVFVEIYKKSQQKTDWKSVGKKELNEFYARMLLIFMGIVYFSAI